MQTKITYHWIETEADLAAVCQQASQKSVIALDTEFVRVRSFYPALGVIQIYDGEQVSLIDPIKIKDFSPFIQLLANQQVLKVLHACGEDLDVFQHKFQQLPTPMLDTQVAAAFLGLGTSIGFAKLVAHYFQIELDKGASRTDWLQRPLSDVQLQYAAADVWHLLPVYYQLHNALLQSPWQQAIAQECQVLIKKRQQSLDPNFAYLEIGNAWQLSRAELAILKVLAKWRYEEAEKRDLALNFVVKEQHLWQIAKIQPVHTSALLEFMHPNEVRIHGKKLLWLVEQGKSIPERDFPEKISRIIDEPNYKACLKALQQKMTEIKPENLAGELLATKRQLNQLFKWYRHGQNAQKLPELLTGWRQPYGEQLLSILAQFDYIEAEIS